MTALSWKPVKSGEIYCSPACGGKCTTAAWLKATKDAAELCLKLGSNWRPRVWENLGWHCEAVSDCGRWKVSFKSGIFIVFVHLENSTGGVFAVENIDLHRALHAARTRARKQAKLWASTAEVPSKVLDQ